MTVPASSRPARILRAAAAGAVLLVAPAAMPHGAPPPQPTDQELRQIQPAIPGSEEFARSFLKTQRYRMTAAQTAISERAGLHLAYVEGLKQGKPADPTTATVEYNRWLSEKALLELVEAIPETVRYDFRPGGQKASPDTPLAIDAKDSTLFFKIVSGDGPVRFTTQELDYVPERFPEGGPYRVPVEPNGTTYVQLNLNEIPSGTHIHYIQFVEAAPGGKSFFVAYTTRVEPKGQLAVRVLDENGKPAPVMMRLTAKKTGKLFQPAGSVDFRPQMNAITQLGIYGPGRGYTLYIPGRYQGVYWVVPGPFDMALPAGEWDIHIVSGIEREPQTDTFSVEPGKWTRKEYRLRRWVDMASRGWYAGDDHIHARLMSSEDAANLMTGVKAQELNVANILEMGDHMRSWYEQRGFGPDFRVSDGDHWLVPGQEDPRSHWGHVIGLNLRSTVRDPDKYLLNDWVAREIHRQGGLYGHTHVGAKALFVEREMSLMVPTGLVDFDSIMQAALGTDYYYDFLNLGYKLTASAGTDTPYGGFIGTVRLFAFAGLDRPFTPDAYFDAVKKGHTFVSNGPMLDLRIGDAMPGDRVEVDGDQKLRIEARAWGLAGESAPAELRIVRLGDTLIRKTSPADGASSITELVVDEFVQAGHGFWIAAHARGRNGSEAHTTPIYVTRKGFRHWNVEKVKALVDQRLQNLADIESIVTLAEKTARNQPAGSINYWDKRAADQAAPVRERVNKMREVYKGLLKELDGEMGRRKAKK